jgi:hypothetical protein
LGATMPRMQWKMTLFYYPNKLFFWVHFCKKRTLFGLVFFSYRLWFDLQLGFRLQSTTATLKTCQIHCQTISHHSKLLTRWVRVCLQTKKLLRTR